MIAGMSCRCPIASLATLQATGWFRARCGIFCGGRFGSL